MAHGHGIAFSAQPSRNGIGQPGRRVEPAASRHRPGPRGQAARQLRGDPSHAVEQQGLTLSTGISQDTVGSKALCMRLMMLPPGTRGTPHSHKGHESAIWVAMGEAEVWHGPGLCGRTVVHAGDFLYIPPGIPHLPVNRSETKMMVAVMARTDPAERESVILVRPAAAPGRPVRRPGSHGSSTKTGKAPGAQ